MATKSEVKGVTAHRTRPVIIPQPYSPENQFLPKAEFIRRRQAHKAANQAAEEAKEKVLREKLGPNTPSPEQNAPTEAEKKIADVRKKLANAQKNLSEKPDSKSWKAKVQALEDELEVLESEA